MKKIGIVTNVSKNYGTCLQIYAMQKVMRDIGLSPETFRNPPISPAPAPSFMFRMRRFLRSPKNPFLVVKNEVENRIKKKLNKKRNANFESFLRCIVWSEHTLQEKYPGEGEYDYYLIGSDQVWNFTLFPGRPWKENAYLLAFAPGEKRICFSPSFGVKELLDEWKPLFREQLSKFRKIAVREDAGAAIVKELTGKDAEVLIDPTCMLDAEKWMEIAKMPMGFDPKRPYILAYFLRARTDRINQDLQNYANTYNLRICSLLDLRDRKLYPCGPSEFLWLFANAKLILTDSFHGSVFSFLFQKPFVVYPRSDAVDRLSRFETLLGKFDLSRKFVDSGLPNDLFECDYQKGYEQLKLEREKVRRFLLESLGNDPESTLGKTE